MKKLFSFVITAILCGTAAFAQSAIVSSRSTSISVSETPSNSQWVLRAGANFAGFCGDGADELDSKFAYDVALSFQKPLSDFGMYWGMELGLGTRGFSYSEGEYETNGLAHNIRFSPFTFGYAYAINESVKIDAHLGAWLSYDLFGEWTEEYDGEEESVKISDIEDYNNLDYGVTFGIGVWYDRYNLDLSWQRGFSEVIKDSEMSTNNMMIRLGIAF